MAIWARVTPLKKEKLLKIIFSRDYHQKNPVSGKAMVKGKMLHFVAFFVHFYKLIRPHPGPLWGGTPLTDKIRKVVFDFLP